ncbi:HNH endonuclease signature motif containing protein [Acidithiobacillus sp.]|uniref:HNH endonuclease signature motif containing protein n=1 Tax=Acidithiobacillus sp. TaxID=1872118 RepID=UPI003390660D
MTSCQNYEGKREPCGYGYVYMSGRKHYAHRLAFAIGHGVDPAGKVVRHTCDNRSCVNPDHLELGSHQDNMDDMVARGRQSKGERHPDAKLTMANVLAIRGDRRPQRTIAAEYGVTQANISAIKTMQTWRFA